MTSGGRILAILLLAAALAACSTDASQASWLHGTWTLAYNPGNDSQDVLTFDPDGKVEIRTSDARRINGTYHLKGQTLLLLLEGRTGVIDVQFEISPDHARLLYPSGAYYTR
ncbi:MAG: hypothetical protein IT488_05240, partial [Gammaproteobacteria bacterium]|nr:hypothetical protein [Gammaproteobacteria bacterium]